MSETTPQVGTAQQRPPLVVNIQYVKDLSFEVPGAPQIYTQLRAQPAVNINLDVQARRIQDGQDVFEVSLLIRAEAHEAAAGAQAAGATTTQGSNGQAPTATTTNAVFVAELTYSGVFTLSGLPENAVEPVPAGRVSTYPVPLRAQPPCRRDARGGFSTGSTPADRFRGAVASAPRARPSGRAGTIGSGLSCGNVSRATRPMRPCRQSSPRSGILLAYGRLGTSAATAAHSIRRQRHSKTPMSCAASRPK